MKKFILILMVLSLSIFAFGCSKCSKGSKTANSNSKGRTFNASDMKNRLKTNIDSLVTDGTITQTKEDKILSALTSNMQKKSNQNKGTGKRQSMFQNSLDPLVKDGTITQAQADTIIQKISQGRQRNGNDQSGNQSSSNDSISGDYSQYGNEFQDGSQTYGNDQNGSDSQNSSGNYSITEL